MARKLEIMSFELTFDAELSIFLEKDSNHASSKNETGYQRLDTLDITPSSALDRRHAHDTPNATFCMPSSRRSR
jgi:hypothetical protein